MTPQWGVYSSNLTEAEWQRVEAVLPPAKPNGRPPKYSRRAILNSIFYVMATDCAWEDLPPDLPPAKTIHHYLQAWRGDATWRTVYQLLTAAGMGENEID